MDYLTIPAVELVSVGMEWPAANGPITFTFEHLADAMTAANEDPHVVPPRLKIGHSDPRFADPDDPGHDPFYDGEPAFGSVRNLRLVNDGATLIGDYVEVPLWLAEALPSAYPSRSIEGAYTVVEGPAGEPIGSWDVETPGNKKYSFVLTACALLGLSRPAVQDLEDLRRFLTEGDGVVISGSPPEEGSVPTASIGDVKPTVQLSADVEKVVDSFYADFAEGPDDPKWWWWVRAVWTDPNVLIVDDDEGGLLSIPFTSDGDQVVSFGEETQVIQTFTPAPAAAVAAAAAAAVDGKPRATFKTPDLTRPEGREQGGAKRSAALRGMDLTDSQRRKLAVSLGLKEDAPEDEVQEAIDQLEPEDGDGDGNQPEGGDGEEKPAEEEGEGDGEEKPADTPPAASADGTTVVMDAAAHKAQADRLTVLEAAEAKRVEAHRKGVIDAAIGDGKIMPSSRKAWEVKMAAEPDATEEEIGKLAAGLVPTEEAGHSRQGDEPSIMAEADAAFAQLYPNLARQQQEAV